MLQGDPLSHRTLTVIHRALALTRALTRALLCALGLTGVLGWIGPVASAAEPDPAASACRLGDPGFGIYHPWVENLEMGRMLMPRRGGLTADGRFDLIIHFHGGNAMRKVIADSARGAFIVGIDLGAGSAAYGRPFSDPRRFTRLLEQVEQAVADYTGRSRARLRHIGLTGWSAGYGAIRAILRQPSGQRVDSVALIDGLHSDYDDSDPLGLQTDQLKPFVHFARRAARGKGLMFVSHSSIVPPGYASTTETAHYLIRHLGVDVRSAQARDSAHLNRYEQVQVGNFFMYGYQGEQAGDHCAQLALIRSVVETLEFRWKTPPAQGKAYEPPV